MDYEFVSNEDVLKALKKYYGASDFKLIKWELRSLNEDARLGYLGDHFLVDITVRRQGPDEKLSFFVKTVPEKKMHQELVESAGMFKKEVLFYNQLADEFISILSELPPATDGLKLKIIPRCYLAKDQLMMMENLVKLDFEAVSSDTPFSLDFFLVSIRSIARYHAASIVLEHRSDASLSKKYPDLLYEPFLNNEPNHYLAPWHAASVRAAQTLVPLLDKYKNRPDIVKKTQDALPTLVEELMKRVRAWPDTVNVFCHGDLWTNNLLFQLDCGGKPTQAVLVDYQLLRYAPPAVDIITFLMFSADKEFRDKHFYNVVREYHNELSRTLRYLDIKPEKVLPWSEFLRTIEEMKKYGLVLMSLEYPFSLAPAGALDSILSDDEKFKQHYLVDRTPFALNLFKECAAFRSRFTEVMEELIDKYIVADK